MSRRQEIFKLVEGLIKDHKSMPDSPPEYFYRSPWLLTTAGSIPEAELPWTSPGSLFHKMECLGGSLSAMLPHPPDIPPGMLPPVPEGLDLYPAPPKTVILSAYKLLLSYSQSSRNCAST